MERISSRGRTGQIDKQVPQGLQGPQMVLRTVICLSSMVLPQQPGGFIPTWLLKTFLFKIPNLDTCRVDNSQQWHCSGKLLCATSTRQGTQDEHNFQLPFKQAALSDFTQSLGHCIPALVPQLLGLLGKASSSQAFVTTGQWETYIHTILDYCWFRSQHH